VANVLDAPGFLDQAPSLNSLPGSAAQAWAQFALVTDTKLSSSHELAVSAVTVYPESNTKQPAGPDAFV